MSERVIADPGVLVRPAKLRQHVDGKRFAPLRRLIGPLAVLALWTLSTNAHWVDPTILPSPIGLGETLARLWTEQNLPAQIGVSLVRAVAGAFLGISLGLALGLVAGLWRLGEEFYDALVQMLRTVPF